MNTVNIDMEKIDLVYKLKSNYVNCIGLVKNNVTTTHLKERVVLENNIFEPINNPGLLKLVVLERHKKTGNIGKAIVKDYGLKDGALAMTISHDSHNLICIGDNDLDMSKAINKASEIGGGIVLSSRGKIKEFLQLEVGGLMSLNQIDFVEEKLNNLDKHLRALGVSKDIEDPMLQLAFLSLPVIPELKVSDLGLFDVNAFKIIPLEVGED
jgi:adenine deaminase